MRGCVQSSAHQFTHSQLLKIANISAHSREFCTILQSDERSLTQQRWRTPAVDYAFGIFLWKYTASSMWCVQAQWLMGLICLGVICDLKGTELPKMMVPAVRAVAGCCLPHQYMGVVPCGLLFQGQSLRVITWHYNCWWSLCPVGWLEEKPFLLGIQVQEPQKKLHRLGALLVQPLRAVLISLSHGTNPKMEGAHGQTCSKCWTVKHQ